MALRQYANAPATTLAAPCTSLAVNITVTSITGLPITYPYILILDRGTASEEVVLVTAGAGVNLTVTRGYDGTTAFSHATGAVVEHGVSAIDPREANTHVNSNSGVHGVAGSVVGTSDAQTLTNKTISADNNTLSGIAASSFVLSNAGGNIDGAAAQKAVPAGTVVGTTDAQTLTNKTISADNNTLSGIAASSFVLSDASGNIDGAAAAKAIPAGTVVGTTDAQTLANKTLTSPTINDPTFTGVGQRAFAIKTADESVSNSSVLQDDDHLTFTLPAGTWIFDLALFPSMDNDLASDIKLALLFSGTQTAFIAGQQSLEVAATSAGSAGLKAAASNIIGSSYGAGVVLGAYSILRLTGSIVVTVGGTFKLQWAQLSASPVTTTTLAKGSWMRAERVA